MDRGLLLHQQKMIKDLSEQLDRAEREAGEWRERTEAIHHELTELSDQVSRGDFIKAKKVQN